ncbi:MAG: hypothetical protein AAFV93_17080 [Chloroflexota bacterium]
MVDPTLLQAFSSILSVVIAAVALFTAIRSERRANKQFQENIRLQREVITLNQKPVLNILIADSINTKGVILKNVGNGTAVITKTHFRVQDRDNHDVRKILKFPHDKFELWDQSYGFNKDAESYLQAGETLIIATVTRNAFETFTADVEEIDEAFIQKSLTMIAEQLNELEATIEYQDILGNPQPPCEKGKK